jgi:hypothetical protein
MKSAKIYRRAIARTGLASVLALAVCGCGQGDPAFEPDFSAPPDAETLAEEARYMHQIATQKAKDDTSGVIRLDLSDDRQYQFLVHRVLASGNTPENSPRLFSKMKQMRVEAVARAATSPKPGGDEPVEEAAAALNGPGCEHFLDKKLTLVDSGTKSKIHVSSLVTCFGGANYPYAYADVTTYETDTAGTYYTPTSYQYMEKYGGVTDFLTLPTESPVNVNVGLHHYVDSVGYVENDLGESEYTYAFFKGPAENPNPTILIDHPKEWNGGAPIRVCIKRSSAYGNGDCDYAAVDASGKPATYASVGIAKMTPINGVWMADPAANNRWLPWAPYSPATNLYLPLAGTFDAGKKGNNDCVITGFEPATAAVMTLKSTGGWCNNKIENDSTSLYEHLKGKVGATTAKFNLLANFGPDCLWNLQDVRLLVKIVAKAQCGNGQESTRVAVLKTDFFGDIDYKNSCFAKGTGILRADGRYAAVEEIQAGDRIVADESGLALTVVSITRGGETDPMVRIIDNVGHNVLLTAKHPVVTSAGVLWADQITEQSEVETENGFVGVASVSRVKYDGEVYNLTLGTPDELAAVSAGDRTMFAGGIRVGDNEMQWEMERASLRVRKEIPPSWMIDYENDVNRNGNVLAED